MEKPLYQLTIRISCLFGAIRRLNASNNGERDEIASLLAFFKNPDVELRIKEPEIIKVLVNKKDDLKLKQDIPQINCVRNLQEIKESIEKADSVDPTNCDPNIEGVIEVYLCQQKSILSQWYQSDLLGRQIMEDVMNQIKASHSYEIRKNMKRRAVDIFERSGRFFLPSGKPAKDSRRCKECDGCLWCVPAN